MRKIAYIILTAFLSNTFMCVCGFAKTEETIYSKAIQFVIGTQLMEYVEEHDFKSEQVVKREEFAEVISKLCKLDSDESSEWKKEFFADPKSETQVKTPQISDGIYNDVSNKSSFYAYIKSVTEYGLMSGDGNGNFEPERIVTMAEVQAVLIKVLGYEVKAKMSGGYPVGYNAVAVNLNITKGSNIGLYEEVTRGDLAGIIYNCLDIPILQPTSFGSTITYETDDNKTMLTEVLKMQRVKGIIMENDVTSLVGDSNVAKNQIKIDNIVFSTTNDEIKSMVGFLVTAYSTKDCNEEIQRIVFATKEDDFISFNLEDFININENNISYYSDNKTKSYPLQKGVKMIYNGKALSTFGNDDFKYGIGNVTLAFHNGNACAVIIVDCYESMIVGEVDLDSSIIYNKLTIDGVDKKLVLDENDVTVKIVDTNNNILDLRSIKVGDAIDVSKNGDFVSVIVSRKKIENFTVESKNNKYGKLILSSSHGDYKVNYSFEKSREFYNAEVGSKYTAYLNSFDEIVWLEGEISNQWKSAYLVKIATSKDINKDAIFIMLSTTGDKLTTTVQKKVTVSDENNVKHRCGGSEELFALLGNYQGIIRFKLNSDGLINYLELPLINPKGNETDRLCKIFETSTDENSPLYYNKLAYKTSLKTFGGKIYIDDNKTKVFLLPNVENPINVDDYTIGGASYFGNDLRYEFKAYATEPDKILAEYVVCKRGEGGIDRIQSNSIPFVVSNIATVYDDEYGNITQLEGFSGSMAATLLVEEDDVIKKAVDSVKSSNSGVVNTYEVKAGDIIRYTLDGKGKFVSYIEVLYKADMYRPDTSKNYAKGWFAGTKYMFDATRTDSNPFMLSGIGTAVSNADIFNYGSVRGLFGSAYSVSDGIVKVTTQDLTSKDETYDTSETKFITNSFLLSKFKVYTVTYSGRSKSNVSVKAGEESDIRTYQNAATDCSRIIAILSNGEAKVMYIINGEME